MATALRKQQGKYKKNTEYLRSVLTEMRLRSTGKYGETKYSIDALDYIVEKGKQFLPQTLKIKCIATPMEEGWNKIYTANLTCVRNLVETDQILLQKIDLGWLHDKQYKVYCYGGEEQETIALWAHDKEYDAQTGKLVKDEVVLFGNPTRE